MSNTSLLLPAQPGELADPFDTSGQPESWYAPVPSDEIAFALSLFVAAGSGRGPAPKSARNAAHVRAVAACREVFVEFCSQVSACNLATSPFERTLASAFLTLWQHFEDHPLQRSICARVLSFHLLVEASSGSAIETWVTACEEHPEMVLLHPAIIKALACVPLKRTEGLRQVPFLDLVRSIALCRATD